MQMLFDILVASGSDDWGHGWWIVWPLVWLAVIVGVVWLIRSRRGGPPRNGVQRARDILAERFAKGELDAQEYRERLGQLD
jgi:putative membrane protein